MDYLILLLLIGTMYILSGSLASLSTYFSGNRNIVSLIYGLILAYPIGSYFIRISAGSNDYDFLGIFIQSLILKLLVFCFVMILKDLCNNQFT